MIKRLITLAVLAFCFAAPSWAARVLPDDMDMAVLKAADYPRVVLTSEGISWLQILTLGWLDKSQVFEMNTNVRIRNQKNLFVTHNKLPQFAGQAVAVRRDKAGRISEIWVLTPQEKEIYRRRAQEKAQRLR